MKLLLWGSLSAVEPLLIILGRVLLFSEQTATGSRVLIQGVEMGFVNVPLHQIAFNSLLLFQDKLLWALDLVYL